MVYSAHTRVFGRTAERRDRVVPGCGAALGCHAACFPSQPSPKGSQEAVGVTARRRRRKRAIHVPNRLTPGRPTWRDPPTSLPADPERSPLACASSANHPLGDGKYLTWVGRTAARQLACFVADLEVLSHSVGPITADRLPTACALCERVSHAHLSGNSSQYLGE